MKLNPTVFLIAQTFLLPACTSKPNGELQIWPQMTSHSRTNENTNNESPLQGRLLYIEIYAYPQVLDGGDIFSGGPFLLALEREKVSLDSIVQQSEGVEQ